MATTSLGGNPVSTNADLPKVGAKAPEFNLTDAGLGNKTLNDYSGIRLILNVFPSIDTPTCATSVRQFNKLAASLENTKVLCISHDLPFAQKRFCGAEGIENVEVLSDFRGGNFGKSYGLELISGALTGLHARAVIVLDENGTVKHEELVADIKDEPNYDAALASL